MEEALTAAARPTLARIARDRRRASAEVARILDHVAAHLFDLGFRGGAGDGDAGTDRGTFTAELGVDLGDYVGEAQLETGVRLLFQSRLASAEISRLLGYHAAGVFSNAVERTFGLTPAELRRHARPARKLRAVDADDEPPLSAAERARFVRRAAAHLPAFLDRLPPATRSDLRRRVLLASPPARGADRRS